MALTNLEILKLASAEAPELKRLLSRNAMDIFTEAGYEAFSNLPGGRDKYLNAMMMVSRQYVTPVAYKDALKNIGIIERFGKGYGAYIQDNRMGKLPNENPYGFGKDGQGFKNGDWFNENTVRKPLITQDYYGVNKNYSNHFSWQQFNVKLDWLNAESGLDTLMGQAHAMMMLDYTETEYAWFFEAFSGAINSTSHPLRDSQKLVVPSWGSGAGGDVTLAEAGKFVKIVKDVFDGAENVPSVSLYNAADFPSTFNPSDMVLLVRTGYKSTMDEILAPVYHDGKYGLPVEIKSVPNFGGLIPADAEGNELQPVYTHAIIYNGVSYGEGSVIGYVDASVTVNDYAKLTGTQWTVNVTSGSTTADTTFAVGQQPPKWNDPNEDVIAVLAQRGVIFEMIAEDLVVESKHVIGGRYDQTYVTQFNNGINYRYTRNLVTISKPSN